MADKIPLDDRLDLDSPTLRFIRRLNLELIAQEQDSDLYCPNCRLNLPYTEMTLAKSVNWDDIGFDGCPAVTISYYCPLCDLFFEQKNIAPACQSLYNL